MSVELAKSLIRNGDAFRHTTKPVDPATAQLWVDYAVQIARAYLRLARERNDQGEDRSEGDDGLQGKG
jgi:hypothetical protein